MGGTGDTGVTLLRAGWSRPPQTPPGWGRRPMGWTGMGGASPPTGAVPKIKAQGMGMGWAGAFLGQHKNPGVAYMCMYVYSTYSTPRGVCWDWGGLGAAHIPPPLLLGTEVSAGDPLGTDRDPLGTDPAPWNSGWRVRGLWSHPRTPSPPLLQEGTGKPNGMSGSSKGLGDVPAGLGGTARGLQRGQRVRMSP